MVSRLRGVGLEELTKKESGEGALVALRNETALRLAEYDGLSTTEYQKLTAMLLELMERLHQIERLRTPEKPVNGKTGSRAVREAARADEAATNSGSGGPDEVAARRAARRQSS